MKRQIIKITETKLKKVLDTLIKEEKEKTKKPEKKLK